MTLRLYKISGDTTAGKLRLYKISGTITPGTPQTLRLYNISGTVTPDAHSHLRLYNISGTVTPSPEAAPIVVPDAEGFDTVTLVASPKDSSVVPDSYVFTVESGSVTLSGTGNTRTFVAPALFNGADIVIGIAGVKGAVTSKKTLVPIHVIQHNSFKLRANGTWAASGPANNL